MLIDSVTATQRLSLSISRMSSAKWLQKTRFQESVTLHESFDSKKGVSTHIKTVSCRYRLTYRPFSPPPLKQRELEAVLQAPEKQYPVAQILIRPDCSAAPEY